MKEIRLNAFDMNCVSHQASGLWRHPRDQSDQYHTLQYWTNLARTLERGLIDALFLADVLGIYDVYGSSPDAALRNAAQVPVNDPAMLISAMALVTRNLGFGLTATLSYEHPFPFARRMSTLDHLTQGRIGWNIVTGYLNSAAKSTGKTQQFSHDVRYEIADEYMQVVYKLWEESWADNAVQRDRNSGIFTDPSKIHPVRHDGKYFTVDAIHLAEPSPQRTPVLFQAGASKRGQHFAGAHAECVFIAGPSKEIVRKTVVSIRDQAKLQGRRAEEPLIFSLLTIVTAPTREDAWKKYEDYKQYISLEGALTLLSGWTGVDFSQYELDEPIRHVRNDAINSAIDSLTILNPDKIWTVGELARHAAIGGMGVTIVGSPTEIADQMEAWMEETGIDGFNLAYAVAPETFEDIVDLIIPELQRRGRYKTAYQPGTLRNKLFSRGDRLDNAHIRS